MKEIEEHQLRRVQLLLVNYSIRFKFLPLRISKLPAKPKVSLAKLKFIQRCTRNEMFSVYANPRCLLSRNGKSYRQMTTITLVLSLRIRTTNARRYITPNQFSLSILSRWKLLHWDRRWCIIRDALII